MYQPASSAVSTEKVSDSPGTSCSAGQEASSSAACGSESPRESRKRLSSPDEGDTVPQQSKAQRSWKGWPEPGAAGSDQTPVHMTFTVSGGAWGGAPGVPPGGPCSQDPSWSGAPIG